jgi:hypothetical protein
MSSLIDRLKATSKLKETAVLSESKIFHGKEMVPTPVPMINVALSGDPDGGLLPGHTMIAGPSKHFKTSFGLLMAAAYLDANPDAVLMFYDTEFGSPQAYFESFGIDINRVLHVPIMNIEQLKFDLVHQLEEMKREDNVIIMLDSMGQIASKKEIDDALKESDKADMTRAKALKSLFRMITPYFTTKNVPFISINHTYLEQTMFPKAIVSGGTGPTYSADNIWIVGRRQDKVGTEVQGYHFVINIEKSRFVREKSKIPISVSFEGGIERYSGLLEVAVELGYVTKPKQGWYMPVNPPTGEELAPSNVREKATEARDFWNTIFDKTDFKSALKKRFEIGHIAMLTPETIEVKKGKKAEIDI